MAVATDRPELSLIREHMIVNGRAVTEGVGRVPVHDPATGEVIAQQVEAGPEHVDAAVRAARAAFTARPMPARSTSAAGGCGTRSRW